MCYRVQHRSQARLTCPLPRRSAVCLILGSVPSLTPSPDPAQRQNGLMNIMLCFNGAHFQHTLPNLTSTISRHLGLLCAPESWLHRWCLPPSFLYLSPLSFSFSLVFFLFLLTSKYFLRVGFGGYCSEHGSASLCPPGASVLVLSLRAQQITTD